MDSLGNSRASRGLLLIGILSIGCTRSKPSDTDNHAPSPSEVAAVGKPAKVGRCVVSEPVFRFGEKGEVEIGETTRTPTGFAVGLIRERRGGNYGAVGLVSREGQLTDVVELAPVREESMPPRPFVVNDVVGALLDGYAAPKVGADTKEVNRGTALSFFQVVNGKAVLRSTMPHPRGETFPFDVTLGPSSGVVVWEDGAAVGPPTFRVTSVGTDLAFGASARVATSGTESVDEPHLLPRPGGYWLAWIARRALREANESAESERQTIEVPAEKRSCEWIELAALDATGQRLGPSRAVSSPEGHIAAFSWTATNNGSDLEFYAREDDTASEDGGGRLVRLVVRGDQILPHQVIVASDVGPGEPDLIEEDGHVTGLFFSDTKDQPRLVFLGPSGESLAPPTIESTLDGGRLLFGVKSSADAAAEGPSLLFAFPQAAHGGGAPVHLVQCSRPAPTDHPKRSMP